MAGRRAPAPGGRLGESVANLRRVAHAFKLKRQAEEERAWAARQAELRRMEEAKLRHEQEERQRQEKRRRDEFDTEVARWRHAHDVRAYVAAALAKLEAEPLEGEAGQKVRERLRWALAYADMVDPLIGDEPGRPSR